MSKVGINFTVGSRTYDNAIEGFDVWQRDLRKIKRKLGDLTRPFDEISNEMVSRIRHRFWNNTFGSPPFPSKTSGFTRLVRELKGQDPDGPKLFASGALEYSIKRLKSPTKTELGEQREVLTLRIGSLGIDYAEDVLKGYSWNIPVRVGEKSEVYIDPDRMDVSISSRNYWGDRWGYIHRLPRGYHTIDVPARNFFTIFREDEVFIDKVIKQWVRTVMGG